jgi:hypothetical protein
VSPVLFYCLGVLWLLPCMGVPLCYFALFFGGVWGFSSAPFSLLQVLVLGSWCLLLVWHRHCCLWSFVSRLLGVVGSACVCQFTSVRCVFRLCQVLCYPRFLFWVVCPCCRSCGSALPHRCRLGQFVFFLGSVTGFVPGLAFCIFRL